MTDSVLVIGRKGTGKTSYAQALCRDLVEDGYPQPLILDPWKDPGWYSPFIFRDPDKFLSEIKARGEDFEMYQDEPRCIIIDEAPQFLTHYDDEMRRIGTHQRHWGIVPVILAQRFTDVNKTARQQTDRLALFQSFPDDVEILSHQWVVPQVQDATHLPELQFYDIQPGGPVIHYKLVY